MSTGSNTSPSLLQKLGQGNQDEEAWGQFVDRYGSRIYQWCLNRKLQPSDAEDVAQDVLVKLAKGLRDFSYDPAGSFRAWLRRVTENALHDFFKDQKRQRRTQTIDYSRLALSEAREELIVRLEAAFDMELLDRATELVRQRVSENRFLAWELSAVKGMSAAEIGSKLEMKIASVYTAKNQIQLMLKQEVQKLENEMGID